MRNSTRTVRPDGHRVGRSNGSTRAPIFS
jgi:hypothetical protein